MRTFRLKKFALDRPVVLSEETGRERGSEVFSVVTFPRRTITGRDRITRRRISWAESPSEGVVGYRLYWAANGSVGYDSDFVDVGRVTAVILPDDVPSFPRVTGQVEIGITAVSRSGNESDMCIVAVFFDFTRPDMPLNLKIEAMKGEGC